MKKKSINDFQIGDRVYHLSNKRLIMIVVEINSSINKVTCRWLDVNGTMHNEEFLPQELGDASELGPKTYAI